MSKKAQGLSLNTIIVAIIVLVVLVVLIMLFTGVFGAKVTPTLTSCEGQGGECLDLDTDDKCETAFGEKGRTVTASDCKKEDNNKVCCIKGARISTGLN